LSNEKKKQKTLKSPGTILSVVGVVLLILVIGMYGDDLIEVFSSATVRDDIVQLTIEEEGFVDALLTEWSQDFRITNIQQAAQNEGVDYNHDMRYRITSYLAKTPRLHRQLMSWKYPTFALTNDEKKLAKFIMIRTASGGDMPTMEEMKKALGVDEDTIDEAFFILYQLAFLDRGKRLKFLPGPYSLNPDHAEHVPDWSLHYTEIVREDGRKFNVQCFLDALKLIYEDFLGEKITINTYCPDCLQEIKVEFEGGVVTDVQPTSLVVLKGGTCPTNLAFVSEGHLKKWASMQSAIEDRNAYSISQLIDIIEMQR